MTDIEREIAEVEALLIETRKRHAGEIAALQQRLDALRPSGMVDMLHGDLRNSLRLRRHQ